jgi:hypothetical protein
LNSDKISTWCGDHGEKENCARSATTGGPILLVIIADAEKRAQTGGWLTSLLPLTD